MVITERQKQFRESYVDKISPFCSALSPNWFNEDYVDPKLMPIIEMFRHGGVQGEIVTLRGPILHQQEQIALNHG
jgi:hypothetical protein